MSVFSFFFLEKKKQTLTHTFRGTKVPKKGTKNPSIRLKIALIVG